MTRALDAADNPYAVPATSLAPTFAALVDAARGARLLAWLVDAGLFGLCWIPLLASPWFSAWFSTARASAVGAGIATHTLLIPFLLSVSAIVALFGANLWRLHSEGQTLGKWWLGLRIVRCDGRHCDLGRSLGLRMLLPAAIALVPFLGLLFVIADFAVLFDEDQRCLHDLFADTRVVRA
ncbi:MAG: RDD family protein [Lysobacteraceae bacterium]|nr:MAG: RDD family protein [Xanthomonadaceae bacterium]